MEGVFITGTDTGVGKTTIAAGLLKLLHGAKPVSYWKPIQTGTVIGDDTVDVRAMTELGDEAYLAPSYRFAEPLAPWQAAKQWGQAIDAPELLETAKKLSKDRFLLVEGAGGILVPFSEKMLQVEFMKQLGLPVLVVAPNKLGTINHTLLTLRELQRLGLPILGVILTKSRQATAMGNSESIGHHGKVEVLAEFADSSDRKTTVAQVAAHPRLRKLFGVPAIPS